MSILYIEYLAPVTCIVDTELGTILEVHVDGPAGDEPRRVYHSPAGEDWDEADYHPAHPKALTAIDIAESEEWPAWEHGW